MVQDNAESRWPQSSLVFEDLVAPCQSLRQSQVLPGSSGEIPDALQKQIERLQLTISKENVSQAERSAAIHALSIGQKPPVDTFLFPRKNPPLYKLRTMSTDRLQTLFLSKLRRCFSGDTLVELDNQQKWTPSSPLAQSIANTPFTARTCAQLDFPMQLSSHVSNSEISEPREDRAVDLFNEMPFSDETKEKLEKKRIKAKNDANWTVVLKLKGKQHYEEISDLKEEHQATLKFTNKSFEDQMASLRKRTQYFQLKNNAIKAELKSMKTERGELEKKLNSLLIVEHDTIDAGTRPEEHTMLREENIRLRGVISFMQDLGSEKVTDLQCQLREKDIEIEDVFKAGLMKVIEIHSQLRNSEVIVDEVFQTGLEKESEFQRQLQEKDRIIDGAFHQNTRLERELAKATEENYALRANYAKDKEAFDANYEQLHYLRGAQEQDPANDLDIQKLLDYKDKQFSDLEKRAGGAFKALRQEQIQHKLGQELSAKRIEELERALDFERTAAQMLRLCKADYKKATEDILGMLRTRITESDVNTAMSQLYDIAVRDNETLSTGAEEQERELVQVKERLVTLESERYAWKLASQQSKIQYEELVEEKRATDLASENLKWKLDILSEEHREEVEVKDATIAGLERRLSIRNEEFTAMKQASLDGRMLTSLEDKEYQIGWQKTEIERLTQVVYDLESQMHQFKDAQFWDYTCDGSARIQKEATSQRLKQLTDEVEMLHQILNKKDLAGKDEAEDSKTIKASKDDLAVLGQQKDMVNNWLNELPQVTLQLLARTQSLEAQLRSRGLEIHTMERAALMSSFWEALRPHVWDVTRLIAEDEALSNASTRAAAEPSAAEPAATKTVATKPSGDASESQQQKILENENEDCYLKRAAEDGFEFARALLARKGVQIVAEKKEFVIAVQKEEVQQNAESSRDREFREAAEHSSLLLNHDSRGTAIQVETRDEYSSIQVEEHHF